MLKLMQATILIATPALSWNGLSLLWEDWSEGQRRTGDLWVSEFYEQGMK